MGEISNGENLTPLNPALMGALKNTFKNNMDSILYGGGEISIDLPANKERCPASCKYNMSYDNYMDVNGSAICRTCRGKGFVYTPRFTTYKCNRRWTNEPLDQAETGGKDTPGGRIYGNFVRTKTHISSFDHISASLGADIDGVKVKLYREPRKTGWGNENFYVVAWWERANKDG